jgi:glutamate dehydrogenase (NADP+)/cyclic pyranopterin phosphate synthase/molybdopterin-guanine dinucleotide biosynthesis protein A
MTSPVLGGVLVGGKSRRMGRPKQLVDLGGGTMVEHVVGALSEAVDTVVLIGSGPLPSTVDRLGRVADAEGCCGPMAGLLGALRSRRDAAWILAPCDLPLLGPGAVEWLVDARRDGAVAVMPSINGFVEPLLALYEPTALGLIEEAVGIGEYALHRLAADPRVATAEPPRSLERCWFNANTPQELQSLRAV